MSSAALRPKRVCQGTRAGHQGLRPYGLSGDTSVCATTASLGQLQGRGRCPGTSGKFQAAPGSTGVRAACGAGSPPRPPRSPVTHQGRQAVRREAGAPELRGVRHTAGQGSQAPAARDFAAPGDPLPAPEVEAAAFPRAAALLAVAHEARGPGPAAACREAAAPWRLGGRTDPAGRASGLGRLRARGARRSGAPRGPGAPARAKGFRSGPGRAWARAEPRAAGRGLVRAEPAPLPWGGATCTALAPGCSPNPWSPSGPDLPLRAPVPAESGLPLGASPGGKPRRPPLWPQIS